MITVHTQTGLRPCRRYTADMTNQPTKKEIPFTQTPLLSLNVLQSVQHIIHIPAILVPNYCFLVEL